MWLILEPLGRSPHAADARAPLPKPAVIRATAAAVNAIRHICDILPARPEGWVVFGTHRLRQPEPSVHNRSVSIRRRAVFALATNQGWEQAVRSLPAVEARAFAWASRYVAGRDLEDALATVDDLLAHGVQSSIDFFGERVRDPLVADRVTDDYVALAHALERAPEGTFLAIDLSHIGLDEPGDGARARLERIVCALPPGRCIQVGAEEEHQTQRILATVKAVASIGGAVSATVQANLRRSPSDADALAEAGVPVRLVKGAYVEDPSVAIPWGEETDLAFLELAHRLHGGEAGLTLATHDPVLREALLHALPGTGIEMLLGVRGEDAIILARRGVSVRVYVPYGHDWFRYAMRRWAESIGA
jgi:proline dehydrogenase